MNENNLSITGIKIIFVIFNHSLYLILNSNFQGIRFEQFDHGHTHINYSLFKHPLHQQIWDMLENPETSPGAKFISALSMGLTVLSVMLFCLETLPELSYLDVDGAGAYSVARNPIFILNTICVIYFSVELLLRFVVKQTEN